MFTATVFGTMTVGQAASLAPNYSKAKLAAARLLALTDTKPSIDSLSEDGKELVRNTTEISVPQMPKILIKNIYILVHVRAR